jgi:predicted permease
MSLGQDVRFTMRQWSRRPGFAAVAMLTLALGIGGATTMYGFLQAIARVGQPTLPAPERVARVFVTAAHDSERMGPATYGDYRRWVEGVPSFQWLAGYTSDGLPLRTADGTDDVGVLFVTPSFLALLETPPVVGRIFTEEDLRTGEACPALLSERTWRSRFGGDPTVLGRTLDLDGQSHTVIGVIPENLGLVMGQTDIFIPLMGVDDGAPVRVIGRRQRQASWAQVRSELLAAGVSSAPAQWRPRLVPILDDAGFRFRMGWLMLVGPALLVLLIGCANVASLLLVRAVQREREIAVRLALGVSRWRLGLQLLVESGLLAAVGGLLGAIVAFFGLQGIHALFPPRSDIRTSLDAATLLFCAAATLLTPLFFGAAPLCHSLRRSVADSLRTGLHRPLFGVGRYHLRDLFAVLEVGLAIGLVVIAFLFGSFFSALGSMRLNFDGEHLLVAHVSPERGWPEAEVAAAAPDLRRLLEERVAAIPGIRGVTLGEPPFGGAYVRVGNTSAEATQTARQVRTEPGYFTTVGLPITLGRGIDAGDAGTPVAVVNEGLAAHLWPGRSPVGQTVYVAEEGRTEAVTVVGVSRDAVELGRLDAMGRIYLLDFRYALYRPWTRGAPAGFDVIARTESNGTPPFAEVRQAVETTNPRLRLRHLEAVGSELNAWGDQADETPVPLYLMGASGGLALLLAIIGVFGVMSQLVSERRIEMGVRLALGASPRGLVGLVVRDGLIRIGLGAALGLAGVFGSVRSGFPGLLGVSASDPRFWLAIVAVVGTAAAAACYVPARRAARVDPMQALRSE